MYVIGLVIEELDLPIDHAPFKSEVFDSGFQELIAHDRVLGGRIYDAVKQIPAFIRLVASTKNEAVVRQVRGTSHPALAAGGYGIRIDVIGRSVIAQTNWSDYWNEIAVG